MKQSPDITLFYISFAAYSVGMLVFILYAAIQRSALHKIGAVIITAGGLAHITAFITRWILSGHIPLSNMYEYISLTGWTAVVVMLFLYFKYKRPVFGVFITPAVFMLMVAAALLPKDINQSLMPALQSIWLNIHVLLAALGAGCFLISFAAGVLYLIAKYDSSLMNTNNLKVQSILFVLLIVIAPVLFMLIFTIFGLTPPAPTSRLVLISSTVNTGSQFILLGLTFIVISILLSLSWKKFTIKSENGFGFWLFSSATITFLLGGLLTGILIRTDIIELTQTINSSLHGNSVKSAWLFFEFIGVAWLMSVILSTLTFPLIMMVSKLISGHQLLKLETLDEIEYRSVSMGYPLYTVGALFAGAIWAEQAWGSFWSWDPKEVGALIVWLFYSGYLHARYQKGWKGSRAAVLVVAGFIMFLVSFFGNYFFGGLHAYI
ncbi:cytochrome c biogenesis protein CcsA [bacterium]|nr:cytochrome c biogenesis protein CcsA [bacterium]